MKQNFSYEEIGKLAVKLVNNLKVCVTVNRAGNINVVDPSTKSKEKWTLYKDGNRYLWRRFNLVNGYCYPLNMRGRKIIYNTYWCKLSWDMNNAYFNTIDDAINYFIQYFHKHKNTYVF